MIRQKLTFLDFSLLLNHKAVKENAKEIIKNKNAGVISVTGKNGMTFIFENGDLYLSFEISKKKVAQFPEVINLWKDEIEEFSEFFYDMLKKSKQEHLAEILVAK